MKAIAFLWLAFFACAANAADVQGLNKQVARRVFDEILTAGKFEAAAELYAADFVNHGRTTDVDLARDQEAARGWRQAAPDLVLTTDLILAEGDLVAVLWHASGTNTGEGNGFPATGKRIHGNGITVWRIVDGKIREEWSVFPMLPLLQEAGLIPGGKNTGQSPQPMPRDLPESIHSVTQEQLDANRRIAAAAFEQIVGQGAMDLFQANYSKNFADHGLYADSTLKEKIDATTELRKFSPDLKVKVTQTIAEGDFVEVTYVAGGTNTGAAMGLPATGKPFKLRGMSIFRIRGGKITDEWSMFDQYEIWKDLGLLEPQKTR